MERSYTQVSRVNLFPPKSNCLNIVSFVYERIGTKCTCEMM
uniref:Uncharacterized protein n=1 Tax=Anguilla anguilla TaxID=7936 RepID=A0A0E9VLK6_ANGAN